MFSEKESGRGRLQSRWILWFGLKSARKCSVAKEGLGKQYEEK